MTKKDQVWVHYDQVPRIPLGDGMHRRILAYGDQLMCVENSFEAGTLGALHSHPHTQITYIVSGVFVFTIEGESRRVVTGDTLFLKGNTVHGCECLETGVILDIYTPMREDFTSTGRE